MNMRWRKGRGVGHPAGALALADEAEAFLSGTYASLLRSREQRVPGWARLNTFAHGDLKHLREFHRFLGTRFPALGVEWHEEPWVNAQRLVANDILGIVGENRHVLSRLQRVILIPLELELIRTESACGLTEYELVHSVRVALRSCIP
jgi:hypothetical protein